MILLLDTSVLIDVLRRKRGRAQLLQELANAGHTLATTAVNIGEVYAGLRVGEEERTAALLDTIECYPLTRNIARTAGLLVVLQKRQGRTLELADMAVAATAIEHGLTLLTDNVKDFPMPELKLMPLPGPGIYAGCSRRRL